VSWGNIFYWWASQLLNNKTNKYDLVVSIYNNPNTHDHKTQKVLIHGHGRNFLLLNLPP
jgi:hypothetical protein